MKIELKPIIDQLTEAIELPNGQKVSALIDDDGDSFDLDDFLNQVDQI
jgi:hypothetical protein